MRASGAASVVRVDERDELVAEVGVVAADPRRVDELRAADRGERVDEHDDGLRLQRLDPVGIRRLHGSTLNHASTMPVMPWIT